MKTIIDFENYSLPFELEPKFEIDVWPPEDLCELLNITNDQLTYLVNRTSKECINKSIKKAFNANFIFEDKELVNITSIGLYLLFSLNYELKNYKFLQDYIYPFEELAIFDLLRYQGFKSNPAKIKRINNIPDEFKVNSFEDMAAINAKKISTELKVPNLNIEDKTHLLYGKKIVITGVFSKFPIRQEMAKLIKSVGGDNNTSISKLTDYVIVGENAGPSKLKKIEILGTKTLTEADFIELFISHRPKYV